jgi:tRNA (cmo5U34)-methyltransferase
MDQTADPNAAIWRSAETVRAWAAEEQQRDRDRGLERLLMARLLPFEEHDAFIFLDLGAGTGAASRAILALYPASTAVLADFSAEMMRQGERQMQEFAGRYRYVEFDMSAGQWPTAIPAALDAVVSSLSVHHLTDERKQGLFAEIFGRLVPGGWFLNYDPVRTDDPVVAAAWERVHDRDDPEAAGHRHPRTPEQQSCWENHVRYMIPLARQLEYLRSAGFAGIDVYWKRLDYVIYGGCRPPR